MFSVLFSRVTITVIPTGSIFIPREWQQLLAVNCRCPALFLHNSIFSITLLAATGDSGHSVFEDAGGGISHQFTTLTKTEFPGLYDYELSNLVYMAGEYSFNPIPEIGSFSLVPRVSAVLRPSDGDGDPATDPSVRGARRIFGNRVGAVRSV